MLKTEQRSRIYYYFLAVITAVDVGLVARYWRAVYTPRIPFIDDHSPLIYISLGFLWSAFAFQMALGARKRFPTARHLTFVAALNGLCFVHYLTLAFWFFWRTLTEVSAN